MDKRELRIRLVDTKTGEILNEVSITNKFNFYFKKDRQVLHKCLDDFIEKLRITSDSDTLSLEFIAYTPYVQGILPF